MEEAAAVREAATDAVGDVEPERLREEITGVIGDGSMAPGVLTLLSARSGDGGDVPDGVDDLAAGVQLIYDGLRLTRTLAREDPWSDADTDDDVAADMEILAADVIVSRGFYLLARTEAASAAVEVVRSFGRDQTNRRERDEPGLDAELERDVVELAVLAGATAVGVDVTDAGAFAADLVGDRTGFPPAADLLTEEVLSNLLALGGEGIDERAVRSD